MHLKVTLIKLLKSIGVYSWQGLIGYLVGAIILAYGGLLYLSKTLLNLSILFLNIQMPLWATTSLIVLCCLYTYVKAVKILSKLNLEGPLSSNPPYIVKYFPIGNYKWETKIYDNNYFEVDEYPLCVKHDLKFIFGHYSKYCPGTENEKCKNELNKSDFFTVYESAKSIIENKVRNKKY